MEALTRFALERSRLTILVMIGLLIAGSLTYLNLPKRENPAITVRTAIVAAQFPGMSPERVEDLIAVPLERAAREIGEVEDIETRILTGAAVLKLHIFDAVPETELVRVFQDIRNKMNDSRGELPEGTQGPLVNTDFGDVAIATIAVTGEGFSYAEVFDAADELRNGLYTVDGVTKVSIFGKQEERIWLELDTRRMAAIGVQLPRVLQDLQAQNVILPAGELNSDGTKIIMEANGDLSTVEEIEGVLTKVPGLSGFVRLKDILTVRRGYIDPPDKPVYFNGQPALMVSVEMASDRDIQQLGRELEKRIVELENQQPIGVTFNVSTFQEKNVTVAVNSALSNVGQTFLVVFAVMMVFLGLRPALIIASIVPFTVMFALILMAFIGVDVQQVSIAAVIISLGLLVDNGLVVVEDIQTKVDAGMSPREAAIASCGQFFIPLAVASLTTIAAFVPMLILDGTEGQFAFAMGAVVSSMLTGSWIVAHYILPFLAARLVKSKKKKVEQESRMRRVYGSVTRALLPWGVPIIVVCYGLVIGSATVFANLKAELFPLSQRSDFLVYLDMPKGTAIEETRAQALAVEQWLRNVEINPEVRDTTIYVGDGGPRFYLGLDPAETDPASAFFVVNTQSFDGAKAMEQRARRHLTENFAAFRPRLARLSMGGTESGIVEIEITGPDGDLLMAAAEKVKSGFARIPNLVRNEDDWGNKSIKMVIDVAQDKARELGITSQDVSDAMETFFSGASYSTFREGTEAIPIVARAQGNFRDSLEDLANLSVPTNGGLISLNQVATFKPTLQFSQIRRENQERMITISGKSETLGATQVEQLLQPTLAALDLGPEYNIRIGGESEEGAKIRGKLAAGIPYAMIVMLAALTFQFNSARRVALTIMTIPLIVVGAPLALELSGRPLSFFAILGLLSLMGIIINNAIVLIDQIDIERQTQSLDDAIVTAAKKRVRPVMLASLTTVLGLVPMALNGGALFEPMATLMVGGLFLASPLTLLFVPPTYRLFFRNEERRRTEYALEAEKAAA
ncbi:efflux RND transporter permease subunit [Ruegeria sp. THAF33]|uniref:efflux RND transporter permease subunit n=1 Tax=Ruegeria sp. THAF33 TaxID=2587853 RepID=UPI001268B797|nr:efflux RND transporter permease subunit [Ruegeria sp. THAF33]QFT75747.1 Multidrug resistance protein MexB [Ruegeria sp. THAF33]